MRPPLRNFVSEVSRPLVRAVGGAGGRGKGVGEESEWLGDGEREAGIRLPVSGCSIRETQMWKDKRTCMDRERGETHCLKNQIHNSNVWKERKSGVTQKKKLINQKQKANPRQRDFFNECRKWERFGGKATVKRWTLRLGEGNRKHFCGGRLKERKRRFGWYSRWKGCLQLGCNYDKYLVWKRRREDVMTSENWKGKKKTCRRNFRRIGKK